MHTADFLNISPMVLLNATLSREYFNGIGSGISTAAEKVVLSSKMDTPSGGSGGAIIVATLPSLQFTPFIRALPILSEVYRRVGADDAYTWACPRMLTTQNISSLH